MYVPLYNAQENDRLVRLNIDRFWPITQEVFSIQFLRQELQS